MPRKWVLVSPSGARCETADVSLYWRLLGQGYTEQAEPSGTGQANTPDEGQAPQQEAPAPEAKPAANRRRTRTSTARKKGST